MTVSASPVLAQTSYIVSSCELKSTGRQNVRLTYAYNTKLRMIRVGQHIGVQISLVQMVGEVVPASFEESSVSRGKQVLGSEKTANVLKELGVELCAVVRQYPNWRTTFYYPMDHNACAFFTAVSVFICMARVNFDNQSEITNRNRFSRGVLINLPSMLISSNSNGAESWNRCIAFLSFFNRTKFFVHVAQCSGTAKQSTAIPGKNAFFR